MPPARLQPLPFPEPRRVADLIAQDPSLLEPGLRFIGRDVPLPVSAGGGTLHALALDAAGRACAIRIAPCLSALEIGAALAAAGWLRENLPALRTLVPGLAGCREIPRCVVLAASSDAAALSMARSIEDPRPEVIEIALFDSPSGLAMSVQPLSAATAPREEPVMADPLKGIPLTSEELAEFRRLAAATSHEGARLHPSPPPARASLAPRPWAVGRNLFLEN